MLNFFLQHLSNLPPELAIIIIAASPVLELRGAIPIGLALGQPLLKTFLLALAGNVLPIIPLLLLLEPASDRLQRFRLWKKFFVWLFNRTKRRAQLVNKYKVWGLISFVAIPLPVTGAWTGSIAAVLFRIKFKSALLGITAGVIIAGIIVSIVTGGAKQLCFLLSQ
jgi:uncharacterized membrane protein